MPIRALPASSPLRLTGGSDAEIAVAVDVDADAGVDDGELGGILQLVARHLGIDARVQLHADRPPLDHGEMAVPVLVQARQLGWLVVAQSAGRQTAAVLARVAGAQLAEHAERVRASAAERRRVVQLSYPEAITSLVQPIVATAGRRVVGVEALTRFPSHAAGPMETLQDAQRLGLRSLLERAALARALQALPELPASWFLAVNLSARVLASGAVTDLLAHDSLPRLVVELTEHDAVDDYELLAAELAPLRRRGLRLAIDDVGAGFASLRHVLRARPDILKIDRAFITGIDADPSAEALVASLRDYAARVGATVVAEGVETPAEHAVMRRLGIDWLQGYLFGVPQTAAELLTPTAASDSPSPTTAA